MPAPLPPDEEERLQELFSHAVLDTGPEPEFDRLTRLTARILHVPMAFISLVDRERQWMKSRHGSETRETKRRDAICAHTILGSGVLIIPDLWQDERFKDLPIATGSNPMRFYAGAPLITPRGQRIGSLCVLDNQPRHLEPDQITLLQDLAALVMDELALRQARLRAGTGQETDESLDALRDELEARVTQRTTLLLNTEGRYRSIFENALEGIYQTLPDGRFLNVNPALAHLLGYATPAALIESVADAGRLYVHEGRRDEFRQEMEARGQVSNRESELRHADGSRVWISETARVIRDADGTVLRYEGLVEDITARKLAEEAVRRAHEELEERVRARTAELALLNGTLRQQVAEREAAEATALAAKEEAEKANRAKSEFLSRMSHELRTPLNAILGFGQLLGLEQLTPMQTSSVEQILKGGRHLLNLINEVLDITRIETGGMELNLRPVNVWTVLKEALQFAAPLASQHGVRFVERAGGDLTLAVRADQGRLHQVLLNLLTNAIKYNRPDGEVRVGARRMGGDKVRLSVSDTGRGIESGRQDELFVPFQRLDAPQQGIEGTGIGLAISKSLVEAMGGSIGVESFPRRGSTFFVDLPWAENPPVPAPAPGRRAPAPAAAPPPRPAAPTVRRVLHIDDNPANVSLVERVLEKRKDLSLVSATNGQDGLARARESLPDLILLDLNMPDLAGDEVVRRLRADERTRRIPVIILSADATPAQAARLRQLDVRDYVTKPFRIRDLLGAIDAVLDPLPPVPARTGA